MAGALKKVASYGFLGGAPGAYATNKGFRKGVNDFLTGTPEVRENVSTLLPQQEPLRDQAINAGMNRGAGGAFGDAADYYRGNLSNNPEDFQAFAAPQLRKFNEETVPGLSEQFAGMGSGGLSSSGFRNAALNAGTDLSERLGAIRASLRQQSAQGLQNIGQVGLGNYSQNMVTEQGTPGLLSQVAPLAIKGAAAYFGGPAGYAAADTALNSFGGNKVGAQSGPYGNPPSANSSNGFNLPNFSTSRGR